MDVGDKDEIVMLLAVVIKAKVSMTLAFRDVIDVLDPLLVIIIIVIYDNVLDLMQIVKLFPRD